MRLSRTENPLYEAVLYRKYIMRLSHTENPLYGLSRTENPLYVAQKIHYMRLSLTEFVRASIRICAPQLTYVGLSLVKYNKAYALGLASR